MEDYSSGWRGAPAKGVGRVTGARVQIPDPPPKTSNNFVRCFFVVFKMIPSILISLILLINDNLNVN